MFYSFLSAHKQGGAERGGQRTQSGLCADSSKPDVGLEVTDPEIVT